MDHSISTLAVKAKSNLADCNIRIHSNPLPHPLLPLRRSLTLLLLHTTRTKPPAFMLSLPPSPRFLSLSLVSLCTLPRATPAFFILSHLSFPTLSFRSISAAAVFVTAASYGFSPIPTSLESSTRCRVNFVRGLVTIEPSSTPERKSTVRLRLRRRRQCARHGGGVD